MTRPVFPIHEIKDRLDSVSSTMCLAKWTQVTMYLDTGFTHSCHHPGVHSIPLDAVAANPHALHNTPHKQKLRGMMLKGERPGECDYCWRIEDLPGEHTSDRMMKSRSDWSAPFFDEVVASGEGATFKPKYVEVSFASTCNFTCIYCMPSVSSKWMEEINRHGPYKLENNQVHNGLQDARIHQKIAIGKSEDNPYTDAFWKVLPDWWDGLHTLRITGGEPLLSKHTWAAMDYVEKHANPDLMFAVNTNLGVPDELLDRFIKRVNAIKPNLREFPIYTSIEATGKEAEYIRYGMNYVKFMMNVGKVMAETKAPLTVMTTINNLCYSTFREFVLTFLRLRERYGRRILLSFNYMRNPNWMDPQVLPRSMRVKFAKDIDWLLSLGDKNQQQLSFRTIDHYEMLQLERLRDYILQDQDDTVWNARKGNLKLFLTEVDRRRGLNSKDLFPNLWEKLEGETQ